MDPLSQATLGAACAALFSRKDTVRRALIIGTIAGAAPDIDVFIRSSTDPLLNLQYHRHFTHSLLAAPVFGLIAVLFFRYLLLRRKWPKLQIFCFATVAALSHGLLDACTSYGTMLYLPFSQHRESWDIISIIDPIFTLPLTLLCIIAFFGRSPNSARLAIILCSLYLSCGYIQRERARDFAIQLANSRDHNIDRITARPSFANILLWRTIYRDGDTYHVDAVRILPFELPVHYPGKSVKAANLTELTKDDTTLAHDIQRFNHFSQDYLYSVPNTIYTLGDLRYSMLPNSIQPLWGVQYDPLEPQQHVQMVNFTEARKDAFQELWNMILGREID